MLINSNLELLSERIAVISNDQGEERFDAVLIGAISVMRAVLRRESRGDGGRLRMGAPHAVSSGRRESYRCPCAIVAANAIEAGHVRDRHARVGFLQLTGQAR